VSVDGVTRSLPDPFFVVATQNPVEHHGTFPLPGLAARPFPPPHRHRISLARGRARDPRVGPRAARRRRGRRRDRAGGARAPPAGRRARARLGSDARLRGRSRTRDPARPRRRDRRSRREDRSRCCAPRGRRRCSPRATTSFPTT
jgi:hypothetical protein